MIIKIKTRHVSDLEAIMIVCVLIGPYITIGIQVQCRHYVNVIMGVVGVRSVHVIYAFVTI